jgi:adapter protein MecA 1/2
MRIEKVSNKQLKILLTNADLEKRNIKIAELAFGSKKTRELFKEMMDIATDEYDFVSEGAQLMIEAIPISLESVVIVVTKMDEEQNNRTFEKMDKNKRVKRDTVFKDYSDSHLTIFEFNTLNDVVLAANILHGRFTGISMLIKKDGKYFLVLRNSSQLDEITDSELETAICEYGRKRQINVISFEYFIEHGDILINDPAIDIINEYL